ncbi:hypothetical protein [Bradyrhizobium sp.]|jgi:hypothetical protein|nr:hypothetical protein [Bradyrhizobium sp.]HEV2155400.1 hypothetical protein [Bradyrhizobium sp.]
MKKPKLTVVGWDSDDRPVLGRGSSFRPDIVVGIAAVIFLASVTALILLN